MKKLSLKFDPSSPRLSQSQFLSPPFSWVDGIRKSFPHVWNLSTSDLADEAFEYWGQYASGQNGPHINKWLRMRENYGIKFASNIDHLTPQNISPKNAYNLINILKWGLVPKSIGLPKVKELVSALLESDWGASTIRFDRMYDDYPKSAQNNASKALVYKENPKAQSICSDFIWSVCEKLSKGKKFTMEELGKVASFLRYKDVSTGDSNYEENPDRIAWDAMGGTNGIIWAKRRYDSSMKRDYAVTPKSLINAEEMSNEYCNSCLMNEKGWCKMHGIPTLGTKVCEDWKDSEEHTKPLFSKSSRKTAKKIGIALNRVSSRASKSLGLDEGKDNTRNFIQENALNVSNLDI